MKKVCTKSQVVKDYALGLVAVVVDEPVRGERATVILYDSALRNEFAEVDLAQVFVSCLKHNEPVAMVDVRCLPQDSLKYARLIVKTSDKIDVLLVKPCDGAVLSQALKEVFDVTLG